MNPDQVGQLLSALKRIDRAQYAKDRNTAIAAAEFLVNQFATSPENAAEKLVERYRRELISLLDALGPGSLMPGCRHHIEYDRGADFSTAVENLQALIGPIERISLG